MEIGNEIGQKIRSAIRAKLVELGAYVDDELPDYVMVMVANKKSEAQMCEDLSLFLGSNTAKFTTWLHGLLQKLLAITSEPNSLPKQADGIKPLPSAHGISQSSGDGTVEIHAKDEAAVEGQGISVAEAQLTKAPKGKTVVPKKREMAVKQTDAIADDEPVIRLSLEHDEFEEETRGIGESIKECEASLMERKTLPVRKTSKDENVKKSIKEIKTVNFGEDYETEKVKPSSRNTVKQSSKDASEQRRASQKSSHAERSESQKRTRGMGSSIGAVVRHDVDEIEEGYDPLHPAIGSVASVVKVTERKSSVPPSLQANKALLLLAMKEAENSVAQFRRSSATMESTKTSVSESVISVRSRLGTTKTSNSAGSATKKSAVPPEKETPGRSAAMVKPVKAIPLVAKPSKTSSGGGTNKESKHESDEEDAQKSIAVVKGRVFESREDTRKVQCTDLNQKEEKVSEMEDVYEEQQLRKILIQQQRFPAEKASSPKFVVTLDGIFQYEVPENEEALQLEDTEEEEEEEEELSPQVKEDAPRNIVRVKPRVQSVEEEEEEEEEAGNNEEYQDEGPSEFERPSKRARTTERCKFWPSCKNGDSCSFHHPSVHCKMFPSCRFGDKCLYIHPNCKFDGVCQNPACPYTHSAPTAALTQPMPIIMPIRMPIFSFPQGPMFAPVRQRMPPALTHPKQIKCRFYPNCTDMNCAFAHPKPCRFGLSCTNKNSCPFSHPQLPTKRQMKWVSRPAQQENV